MKVALVNNRYFVSGGPERYLFNIKNCLENNGHEVIPFSINYSKNIKTKFSDYFVSPIGDGDQVYFSQQNKNPQTFLKNISRVFYSFEVEKAISKLVSVEKPDIAYVLHFLRKLSPSVLVGIKKSNIPLVVRISDFGMVCPQAHCFRDGMVCTKCLDRGLSYSVFHKCVKNSYIASLVSFVATTFHKYKKYFDLIDGFVFTNKFTMEKFVQAGFPQYKCFCLPTFFDDEIFRFNPLSANRKNITFVGRLDPLKGVDIFLEAISEIKDCLIANSIGVNIVGSGEVNYEDWLRRFAQENLSGVNVRFCGSLGEESVADILKRSIASVVPSVWYENLPNSLIESYACGTPVIASEIGSLTHYVVEGKTGYLFEPGSSSDLGEKLKKVLERCREGSDFYQFSRCFAEARFSKSNHYKSLFSLFNSLLDK